MAQEQATIYPINESVGQQIKSEEPATQTVKSPKVKPTQPLPTERMLFAKQLNLLRAYAALSGHEGRPVKATEVGDAVKILSNTVSLANPFFVGIGLLQKSELGFLPSADVLAFARAHEWNPETAAQKLAPTIGSSWFAKVLLPRLAVNKMPVLEAIEKLAQAASAGPEYKNQLRLAIDYLEVAGLVQRDGDYLSKTSMHASNPGVASQTEGQQASPPQDHKDSAQSRSGVSSGFSQMTGGIVQFNITVKVDMSEMSGWSPDRISAFFSGIAQVLAAKGAVERQASQE